LVVEGVVFFEFVCGEYFVLVVVDLVMGLVIFVVVY